MKLPRYLANIVRAGADVALTTRRNFDDLASVLSKYAVEIEGQDDRLSSLQTKVAKLPSPAILGKGAVWDVKSFGTIANAVSYLGSSTATLYITNAQTVSSNLTIPSNISIHVLKGGSFSIATGVTLTINGSFEAGDYQVFTFAGTGAVAGIRHWNAKWVALGDGSTDDQSPLSKVMTCLSGTGGGSLRIPMATYMISSPLVVPSKVSIYSINGFATIKSTPNTGWTSRGMFRYSNVSQCSMRDLFIDGNLSNQTLGGLASSPGGTAGIEIGNGANALTFTNVYSQNHQGNTVGNFGDGLVIADAMNEIAGSATPYDLKFYACTFSNSRRQGCSGIAGYDVRFYGCRFLNSVSDNPGGGVDLEPDTAGSDFRDWLFDGCVFEGNAYGAILNNAQQAKWRNIRFVGCSMRKNRFDGIYVQENLQGTTELIDCYVEENYKNGILITASTNRAIKIRGGTIANNYGYGIDISELGSRHVDIHGTHIYLNSLDGIRLGAVNGGYLGHTILGNRILNNGLGDITAAGGYDGINARGNATHTNFQCKVLSNVIGNRSEIAEIYPWHQINFQAVGYTSAVAADIGKRARGGTSGALGWLKGYDNVNRRWMIQLISGAFANGETVTLASTSETPVSGTGTGVLNAASASYTLGSTQRNGVMINANCSGVEIFDNDFQTNINQPYVDTDSNSRKFLNRSNGGEFENFGVGTHVPDAHIHVVNASFPTIEIGPTSGAARRALRAQYRTDTNAASIWPTALGVGNLPMEIGGSRVRIATSPTGNVQDHSSNVRVDIQDAQVDIVDGDLRILAAAKAVIFQEGPRLRANAGTPEGVVTASPGSACLDATNGVVYVKASGTGNTGWRMMPSYLAASATWDPANLAADGDATATTITVTGAAIGDQVSASLTTIGANNVLISAHVQAVDTVRVVVMNKTGGALDIASGTLAVKVWK